ALESEAGGFRECGTGSSKSPASLFFFFFCRVTRDLIVWVAGVVPAPGRAGGRIDLHQRYRIAPQPGDVTQHHGGILLLQAPALIDLVLQYQGAISAEI